jgi:hypothetical protein
MLDVCFIAQYWMLSVTTPISKPTLSMCNAIFPANIFSSSFLVACSLYYPQLVQKLTLTLVIRQLQD